MDRKTLELIGWKFAKDGEWWEAFYPDGRRACSLGMLTPDEACASEPFVERVVRYHQGLIEKLNRINTIALDLGSEFGWDGYG